MILMTILNCFYHNKFIINYQYYDISWNSLSVRNHYFSCYHLIFIITCNSLSISYNHEEFIVDYQYYDKTWNSLLVWTHYQYHLKFTIIWNSLLRRNPLEFIITLGIHYDFKFIFNLIIKLKIHYHLEFMMLMLLSLVIHWHLKLIIKLII